MQQGSLQQKPVPAWFLLSWQHSGIPGMWVSAGGSPFLPSFFSAFSMELILRTAFLRGKSRQVNRPRHDKGPQPNPPTPIRSCYLTDWKAFTALTVAAS
jgi:hypothetical protein